MVLVISQVNNGVGVKMAKEERKKQIDPSQQFWSA
jgi:hypothetical protein